MNWFFLALVALLCWSGSDLFSKLGSRPDDRYSHWKMVMAVGLVMGLHAGYELLSGTPFSLYHIWLYLPASVLYIAAMVFGYVGLRYIELSVSSPICNSSGAVAALLCFLFLGESMSALQFFAVALVSAAVFLLGVLEKRQNDRLLAAAGQTPSTRYTRSFWAITLPLLYCFLDGLGTFADSWLLENAIDEAPANIAYELTFLLLGIGAFIYVVLIKKQPLTPKREGPKLAAAVCETAGQFAYIFAIGDNAIVAAPMISSYCLFSVLWSRLFLKEKLSWKHYAVIGIAVAGIVILGQE